MRRDCTFDNLFIFDVIIINEVYMNIAICDDNKNCIDLLSEFIKKFIRINNIEKSNISVYMTGDSLIKEFFPHKFNIIFLDIEMPGTDGFNTAKYIRTMDLNVDIIFITNLKDSIQRGYDFNAKGYIYKPITETQINELMIKLINERLRSNKDSFIKLKLIKGNNVLVSLSGIQYFESRSHQITAVSENETYQFIDTITNLTNKLENKGFIRVNQSNLVNIDYIFNISGNYVIIRKGEKITVGRSYKQAIDNALKKREADKWNF